MRAAPPGRLVVWRSAGITLVGLLIAVLGISLLSLLLGIPRFSPAGLVRTLAGDGRRLDEIAVYDLRLPRLVLGLLGGAGLALAGTVLQDSLRNPLAGPELLGVSSGAAAVVATIVVFDLPVPFGLYPWLALGGGLLAAGVVLGAMTRVRRRTNSGLLVLIGAAVSALLGAVVTAVVSLGAPLDVQLVFRFLLGSLAGMSWSHVRVALPWLMLGIPVTLFLGRPLNLLQLGDDLAEGMGLAVVRTRLLAVLVSGALVASVVSVAGAIGFVALAAPHVARRLLGTNDARRVLPAAALVGALLLASADLAARELLSPREVPVGMWTTIVGGPTLLVLLRRQLGRAQSAG